MSQFPTSFFGWVGFILEKFGPLFLSGVGVTLTVALSGTILGFVLGLLVAILRTIPVPVRAPWYKRLPLKVLSLDGHLEINLPSPVLFTFETIPLKDSLTIYIFLCRWPIVYSK